MRRVGMLTAIVMVVGLAPISRAEDPLEQRVAQLFRDYAELDRSRRDVERQLVELTARWRAAIAEWKHVEDAYWDAYQHYRNAVVARNEQRDRLRKASEMYAQAAERWRQVQMLVVISAALDIWQIQRLQSGVGAGLRSGCEDGMSTSAYRRQLESEGRSVLGKQIDHIVPKALGGADHPLNYQVLPALENQMWGADWGPAKCIAAGLMRCAMAVAVSAMCGSYGGGIPR